MESYFIPGPNPLPIYALGPPKEKGPLPALFYFALSSKASLTQEPICQPATLFASKGARAFSFTLPAHEEGSDLKKGVESWPHLLTLTPNPFEQFFALCQENIQFLVTEGWIIPEKIALCGLSRGCFIAAHLGAREKSIKTLLGFAPMTRFLSKEADDPSLSRYQILHLAPQLADKTIRFYIGNRDLRVGTKQAFAFIESIVESAYLDGIRSPKVELILFPSIGHLGHGTPPEIFEQGIDWLTNLFAKI